MAHPMSATFRDQAAGCLPGSPLYARLLTAMADDLDAGGVTAAVLAGREGDRPGTVPPLRLLGGLHLLVLAGQAPELARYYPSAGGTEPPDAAWSAAEPALRAHLSDLRRLLGRTVQTNEPGRACLLYGGLLVASQRAAARSPRATASLASAADAPSPASAAAAPSAAGAAGAASPASAAGAASPAGAAGAASPASAAGAAGAPSPASAAGAAGAAGAAAGAAGARAMPVRLLEVGASAGLMMLVDRYAYAVGDRVLGDSASPLRFEQPWIGAPPADLDVSVEIVQRRGCDPNPIDPSSAEGRRILLSYVWPDWTERVDRLTTALRLATAPPPVDRAGMADWLGAQLATPRPGVLTVVWHSVVRQYIDFPERDAGQAVLARAAAAATPEAPLAYLRFEPRRQPDRSVRFELLLTCWPGPGQDELLATAQGHGIPVTWR
ncbi:MAG: hypothetical protein V7637_6125 [Mycobacteriales bacterium]